MQDLDIDILRGLIKDAAQEVLGVEKPAAPQPPAPAPIKLNIGGKEIEYADSATLAKDIEAMWTVAQQQALASAKPAPSPAPEPAKPKLDVEAWGNRLVQEPPKAIDEAVRAEYGVGIGDLVQAVRAQQQVIAQMALQQEAWRFQGKHDEFEPTQHMPAVLQVMQGFNMAPTEPNFELAWNYVKQNGLVQNQEPEPAPQPSQGFYNQPGPPPPPAIGRGGSAAAGVVEDELTAFARLLLEKQAELLQRMGGL